MIALLIMTRTSRIGGHNSDLGLAFTDIIIPEDQLKSTRLYQPLRNKSNPLGDKINQGLGEIQLKKY